MTLGCFFVVTRVSHSLLLFLCNVDFRHFFNIQTLAVLSMNNNTGNFQPKRTLESDITTVESQLSTLKKQMKTLQEEIQIRDSQYQLLMQYMLDMKRSIQQDNDAGGDDEEDNHGGGGGDDGGGGNNTASSFGLFNAGHASGGSGVRLFGSTSRSTSPVPPSSSASKKRKFASRDEDDVNDDDNDEDDIEEGAIADPMQVDGGGVGNGDEDDGLYGDL